MKIAIFSDLHVEHSSFELRGLPAHDVVVLAGDIHSPGRRAVPWIRKTFGTETPIVFVPGNHEFYGADIREELRAMRDAAAESNVHVLSRDSLTIGSVRFLGCTLWTDYELFGCVEAAQANAAARLYDHSAIQINERVWSPADALMDHQLDRAWLSEGLSRDCDGKTVVVTHHSPSLRSVSQRYAQDPLTPAFSSDLPVEFFQNASLWVHGHHHNPSAYRHHGCLVVCNPRGYQLRDSSHENPQFDRRGVIVDLDELAV